MGIRQWTQRMFGAGRKAASKVRQAPARRALSVENLESRELMAASIFHPHTGVLEIRMAPAEIFVNVLSTHGDQPHGQVMVNYQPIGIGTDQVREIHVHGSAANNQIHLEGVHGNNFRNLARTEIHGKAGHDAIYGSQVSDAIYGGRHGDDIYGNGGQDWLYGENGHDHISGGLGVDYIYGGAGNDWLYGNDHAINHSDNVPDYIYGQGGNDIAFVGKYDVWDHIFSAEKRRKRWF